MEINLEIESINQSIVNELLNGTLEHAPKGIIISFERKRKTRSLGSPDVFEFLIQVTASVSSGILASWLYDKLKNHSKRIKIDKVEIEVKKEIIIKVIEKKYYQIQEKNG